MADANEPKKETVRITLPPREGRGASSDTVRIQAAPDRPVPLTPGADARSQAASQVPSPASRSAAVLRPPTSSSAPVRPPTPASPPVCPPSAAPASTDSPMPPFRPPVPPPSTPRVTPPVSEDAETFDVAMPPRPRVLPPAPRVVAPAAPSSGVSAAPANYPGSGSQSGPKQETARISTLPESAAPARAGVKMRKTQPLLTVPQPTRDATIITHSPAAPAAVTPGTSSGIDAIPMPLIWAAFGISAITLIIQIWNYFGS